jgi:hypothetical protein
VSQFNSNLFSIRGTLFKHLTDNGETWSGNNTVPWLSGFVSITKMAITPLNGVFCGTNSFGIFTSTNLGSSWTNNSTGIPFYFNGNRNVYSTISGFAFDESGFIYASTTEDGLFKSNASTVSVSNISGSVPDKFSLNQNYPNPFNPSTNIEFGLPRRSQVKLRVFDITGREVAAPVDQVLDAGNYKIFFDAGNLTSGVYFYRLQTDSFVETRKMIIVK